MKFHGVRGRKDRKERRKDKKGRKKTGVIRFAKVDAWERYERDRYNVNSGRPPYMEGRVHIYRWARSSFVRIVNVFVSRDPEE